MPKVKSEQDGDSSRSPDKKCASELLCVKESEKIKINHRSTKSQMSSSLVDEKNEKIIVNNHSYHQKENASNNVIMNTPRRKRKNNLNISSIKKKGGKLLRKNLTPPRSLCIGCGKTPKRDVGSNKKEPLSLSSTFVNANNFVVRTCELDPSNFQVEIPPYLSVLASCKICSIMDDYVEKEGIDFDLSTLIPWINKKKQTSSQLSEEDKRNGEKSSVLASLRSISDDIVIEGFFREFYTHENSKSGLQRVEACIFSSDKLRSFFVCYRGSSDLHDKPLQGTIQSQSKHVSKSYQPPRTDVNEDVFNAYNSSLENSVFTVLDRLTVLKPFSDVVVTGHSFGGAIATCAAMSYASHRSSVRVFCQVFGSPLIGGLQFKSEAHALPNLNILRVERKSDPYVSLPDDNGQWSHVGHTLRISPLTTNSFPMTKVTDDLKMVELKCYRFDKNRPSTNFVKSTVKSFSNFAKLKIGNEVKSYLKDLEKVASLNLKWVEGFVGIKGTGDSSDDTEIRLVV